ncbi:MAG: hypothetical protein HYY06_07050 [Deltaproteobacteria bacterium]|nr:hypothetical protein [Deltaproteobacteria bacterium]
MNDSTEKSERDLTDTLITGLVGVGAAWARHGLTIGRTSLQASAKTLETTAQLLGKLAESFAKVEEEPAGRDDSAC